MNFFPTASVVDGLPWGFGAATVIVRPKGWTCPGCGASHKRQTGMHVYLDGDIACTDCARQWCEKNYVPVKRRRAGQAKLF